MKYLMRSFDDSAFISSDVVWDLLGTTYSSNRMYALTRNTKLLAVLRDYNRLK